MNLHILVPGSYVLHVAVENPIGDKRYKYDWTRRPLFAAGARFEVVPGLPEELAGLFTPAARRRLMLCGIRYVDPTQPDRGSTIWSDEEHAALYAVLRAALEPAPVVTIEEHTSRLWHEIRRIVQEAGADPERVAAARAVAAVLEAGKAPIVIRIP